MNNLVKSVEQGDARALAKAISLVENRRPGFEELLHELYPKAGGARVVGITGSPGSGKSTLAWRLATSYAETHPVGIVAVDPSSPYSGGALLGDRIRMSDLEQNAGVYIRSMASRGHLGGIAAATADVVTVLDAAGKDPILVETVGVGQDEVEIMQLAEVSIVVVVPGMGDDVQALKAGIMEIADIFVLNKCDHPEADRMEKALEAMLSLAAEHDATRMPPPIVRTIATQDVGTDELVATIDNVHAELGRRGERAARKREAVRFRLGHILAERLVPAAMERAFPNGGLESVVDQILRNEADPYSIADEILQKSGFRSVK